MSYIDKIFNILKKRYEVKRLTVKKILDNHIDIYSSRDKLIAIILIDDYSKITVMRFNYIDNMQTYYMYNALHLLRFLDAVSFAV